MTSSREIFTCVMIKPTHYDDDGYPILWWRSLIPSNSLAAMNGLLLDAADRRILGPDVDIRGLTIDEPNTRIDPPALIAGLRATGGKALIAFVGVQSNQFPRAVDLSRPFLAAGYPVVIGGFHVSGCLAMLKERPAELVAAEAMGITLFAGEAEEGRLDRVLRDAWAGTLQPVYDYMADLPSLAGAPTPFLPVDTLRGTRNEFSSFDLGRGCPYQCSFCTIINVQGRKSRFRTADDLERIIRSNWAQGIRKFFITDDDLARNKNWEAFFDRMIELRAELKIRLEIFVQVDTGCHRIPGFIDKAVAAGVSRVFIGLENINPDNLLHVQKRQNKITDYRHMLQQWWKHGVAIYAGYIIGFPADTKEKILRDIEIIKRELPINVLEFFFLSPLPGSADHKAHVEGGHWMDPDLNKLDLFHRVVHHPTMSDREWEEAYHAAWRAFYSWDHIETMSRRGAASQKKGMNIDEIIEFYSMYAVENLHPLEGGILRRKHRRDRRPGLPLVNPLLFYPAHAVETLVKMAKFAWYYGRARLIHRRVHADPNRKSYTDIALTPPNAEEFEELGLFTETTGAEGAIRRKQQLDAATMPKAG
ncbi:MAG: radical SAM protein [Siculibacillus sp.]|nr:radical SAM protein [Siculibacillus sp.]